MVLLIRNGKLARIRLLAAGFFLAAVLILSVSPAAAQVPTCSASGGAPDVHAEGLAEKLGDLTLSCTGGTPASTASLTLFIGLNANITNSSGSNGTGITVTVNTGSGAATSTATVRISDSRTLSVQGISYAVPAAGATTTIAVANIRAAIPTLDTGAFAVLATLGGAGANFVANPLIALGVPKTSLLSSFANNGLLCAGAALPPAPIDLPGLISSSTCSSALRATEANSNAFSLKEASATNGLRLVVSISGYPSTARVFVPDVIVGNSGSNATSTTAFGAVSQLGMYTPGTVTGQLLLARVDGADANGAGGTPVITRPSIPTTFSSAYEVALSNGAAGVTYEILDSAPSIRESAQIPVYVSAPQAGATAAIPSLSVRLGPISTVSTSDAASPIPRFISTPAPSDCSVLNDCSASYFPSLLVDTNPITLTGASLGPVQTGFIRVGNGGGGLLNFTVSASYPSGAPTGWLKVTPASGFNNLTVTLTADPAALSPGTYTANVAIDAGQYGKASVPITFTVGSPSVAIQGIVSAATFTQGGPLAPGSIAALFGLKLRGQSVSVAFDGLPAQVFGTYDVSGGTQQQINLLVPPGLGSKTSANVVVTVDGQQSNSYPVPLVPNAPGIFNPGILNQELSVNTATAPTATGKIIAIYMTGLALPLTGQVTVKIGGLDLLIPQYAGEAPTLTGLQQVNVLVPGALTFTGNSAPVVVCIPAVDPTQRLCSPSVPLYLKQ